MRRQRIAVLTSGGGTNLQAIINAEEAGLIPYGEVVLVISDHRGAYALTRAARYGIECAVIDRKEIPDRARREGEMLALLQARAIDMVVLAGFMGILSEEFVSHYPKRMINVHPALIPSFCGKGFYGLHVHEAALAYGVKVTGATVHFVSEVVDGGAIVAQRAVEVRPDDTPETLQKRVMAEAEHILLPQAVSLFCQGRLHVENDRVTIDPAE